MEERIVIYIGKADQPAALGTLEGNGSDRVIIMPEEQWKRENRIIREREREACAVIADECAGGKAFKRGAAVRIAKLIRAREGVRQ